MRRRDLLAVAGSALFNPHAFAKTRLLLRESAGAITVENGYVKGEFTPTPEGVRQHYSAWDGRRWTLVVSALLAPNSHPPGTAPLYSGRGPSAEHRVLTASGLKTVQVLEHESNRIAIKLSGNHGRTLLEQTVSLETGAAIFHIEVRAALPEPKIEYLLSAFIFEVGIPDFTHAPCLKREPDDIIADRVFHSPAVILEKGHVFAALCPDLDMLRAEIVHAPGSRKAQGDLPFRLKEDSRTVAMPAILDVDRQSGLTTLPVFAYGYAGYTVRPHVYWRHDNHQEPQSLSTKHLKYAMDVFVSAAPRAEAGYQRVSRSLWAKYGSPLARQPKPQAMPFAEYARVCYPAAFAYRGDSSRDVERHAQGHSYDTSNTGPWPTWLEFEDKGGLRGTPPGWYNDVQFTGWWNNVHLAQGLYWWGEKLANQQFTLRAQRIISLALSAPAREGIFPAIYRASRNAWVGCYWKGGWNFDSDFYQTCSASRTATLLLRYSRKCAANPDILPFVRNYGKFLVSRIDERGCVPAWFTPDLKPSTELRFNAEGGVHIGFLSELYIATRDRKYLDAALHMAAFLQREILPQQRWADFETFYSCSAKPEDTFDPHTGQWPRCTLSMLWAIDGLNMLYEATRHRSILNAALAVADYAVLYQSIWQPHFVTSAYVFGGFTVQNTDAEWLDMRQCLFAEALVRLGVNSGRQDLLERGASALRASFATINHPRHLKNGIFSSPAYPPGISPENIDHDGVSQACLRSGPDWGECGALASAAEVLSECGSIYVDMQRNLAVGFDGVAVNSVQRRGKNVVLEVDNLLSRLKVPFESSYSVAVVVDGLPAGQHELTLNGTRSAPITGKGRVRFESSVAS